MRTLLIVASGLMLSLGASNLPAQVRFGGHLSFGDEADLGLGARVVFGLDSLAENLEGIVAFDYFFPSDPLSVQTPSGAGLDFDITYFEINANVAYNFILPKQEKISPYIGGGINIAHASVSITTDLELLSASASDTDIGLNLLGGAKFGSRSKRVTPFVELRFEIGGGKQSVITAGILF